MPDDDVLQVDKVDGIAVLLLNRPSKLNTLSPELAHAFAAALDDIRDDRSVRAVVVAGEGRHFCAGADIAALEESADPDAFLGYLQLLTDNCIALSNLEQPSIAAIHGVAYGGGFELALACDLRIADETARFALPEIKLGIIPGSGGTQRAPRLLPRTVALQMMLTGEPITADEAEQYGLVSSVEPAGEALAEARDLAVKLAAGASRAQAAVKRAVREGMELSFEEATALELRLSRELSTTHDRAEGARAFLEKREPKFTGS